MSKGFINNNFNVEGSLTAGKVESDGIIQAWARLDQTAAPESALLDSYNVSSVTDNAPGDWTITYTNSLSSNYAWSISIDATTGSQAPVASIQNAYGSSLRTQCQVIYSGGTFGPNDYIIAFIAIGG